MPLPGQLNPPYRVLLGPGPSDVHPRVLGAMATPLVGHLDPAFLDIMNETQDMLRQALHTQNPLTFPVSATGMAGMETCIVNLIEPGDKMVACVKGYFGQRIAEVATRAGAALTKLERPWGEVFDLNQLREVLTKVRPKVLAIVQAETSTGALQPLEGLAALCREYDTLLLVDAVTSLGCVPLHLDDWGIDEPRMKAAIELLAAVGLRTVGERDERVLIVLQRDEASVWKSFRNLGERVQLVIPDELNTYDVLVNDWLVFSKATLEAAVARFAGTPGNGETAVEQEAGAA